MNETPDAASAKVVADRAINRGALTLLAVILATLAWYLAADRMTPYTSQARIEGFVVGVAPKVAGLITEVLVENNSWVEAGQPLFVVDSADYDIALERAQSELEKARRSVQAGDASVIAARAALDAALANEIKSTKDYERLSRLYEQDPGTISQRRLEISAAALEAARAQVAMARADIQRAIESKGGDDNATNAFLNAAESAVAKAELDRANTTVRASSAGVITDQRAEVGQFAAVGNPVMTLVANEQLWINAAYTENNLAAVVPGAVVEILFDVLPGQVFRGRIGSVGLGVNAGKRSSPGTLPTVDNNRDWLRQAQRFPVQIDIDFSGNPELRTQLRIGGQASVMTLGDAPAPLRWLGQLSMRIRTLLSYAY